MSSGVTDSAADRNAEGRSGYAKPMPDDLAIALAAVPAGAWAVGVSGGADSVALATTMTRLRPDCRLMIVHVDHHLRGAESDGDAAFVRQLAEGLNVPAVVLRRDKIEATADRLPANPSARYRAARLIAFAEVVRRHHLDGVLLAHHADDVAETAFLRLLRGSGLSNLGGIRRESRVPRSCTQGRAADDADTALRTRPCHPEPALRLLRPLIGVRRAALREWLASIEQPWREDSSNDSPAYRRNVVRRVLDANPPLTPLLLALAEASDRLREAASTATPPLALAFAVRELRVAPLLARTTAMRWLIARGVPAERATTEVCDRLIAQATDVTQSPRRHYPGRVLVRRRAGRVDVIPNAAVQSAHDHGQETDSPAEL